MRSHLKASVVVAALAASPVAFAQWLPGHDYTLDRAGNVIHVRGPSITTPSYLVTGNTSGALVTSTKQVVIGNKQVAIQAAKNIPWKNVATGLKYVARVSPYSMAAGFAVDWLIANNWRVQECLPTSSTCDGMAQWQRKETFSGSSPGHDFQAPYGITSTWRSTAHEVVAADLKPYIDNLQNQTCGTAPTCAKWRGWQCAVSGCWQVLADMRSQAEIDSGKGPYQGSTQLHTLNLRAKQIPVPGDTWVNSPPPDFENEPPSPPDPDKAPDIWDDALPGGIPDSPGVPSVSGPGSVVDSESTTTSNGQTTTNNVTYNLSYNNGTVTITRTETTTNPDGSTTTTEQTVPDDPLTCGLPGMPACNVKVDEAGTPKWEQPSNKALDDIKAADVVKLNEVAQTIPQPDLGWFGAPPIAACRKIVFPHGIGEADPCGVVDSVRSVMAYLWAIVAAWMSFGWIRQAVNGG